MKNFVQRLDAESESNLRYIINKSISSIMSGNFEINVGVDYIIATTISINLSRNEYLIIENEWFDTPLEAIDGYILNVRLAPTPAGIKTEDDSNSKNSLIHYPNFSTVRLGVSINIKEIVVYERIQKSEEEQVQYDSAIFFKREDESSFLITHDDSITGYLKLIIKEEEIQKEISDLIPRLKIG